MGGEEVGGMGSDMGDAVVRAEKKLRQADFFLRHLESASREVRGSGPNPEALEFYFSACLTAAQSAYYVLDGAGGGSFKETQRDWRLGLPETERSRFGRTIGLRDDDVHLATTPTAPLPKYVEEDRSRYTVSHVPMLGPEAVVEMENPDGTKVRGPVL